MFSINCRLGESGFYDYIQQYNKWIGWNNIYNVPKALAVDTNSEGAPCFSQYDIKSINNCTAPVVFIDGVSEGLSSESRFKMYKKDCHYVILTNDKWDQSKELLNGLSYDIVWFPYYLCTLNQEFNNPYRLSFYADKTYIDDSPKPLEFISAIGSARDEREVIVNSIKANVSYSNYILKYSGVDYGIDSTEYDVVEFNKGEFDNFEEIGDICVWQTVPIDMYNLANFMLVVESNLNRTDSSRYVTEKTAKALFTGMPFVVASTPHFLKFLHTLGFTTYNELWDESYDTELNYDKRIDKITILCNQLKTFNWIKNRTKLREIRYNNFIATQQLNILVKQSFERFEEIIKSLDEKVL